MQTAVLIPWRPNGTHRARALDFVTAHYATQSLQVVLGRCQEGPWVKATAVDEALRQTTAEILSIVDADVWVPGLPDAIQAVRDGARWAVPHRGVLRLSSAATDQFVDGEDWRNLELAERGYLGVEGGGAVVLAREFYETCPLDPRFVGWGSEDESWGFALRAFSGPPVRIKQPLIHLFHPPQARITRKYGSHANRDLRKRYAQARSNPTAMAALIEEGRCHSPRC